LDENASLNLLN